MFGWGGMAEVPVSSALTGWGAGVACCCGALCRWRECRSHSICSYQMTRLPSSIMPHDCVDWQPRTILTWLYILLRAQDLQGPCSPPHSAHRSLAPVKACWPKKPRAYPVPAMLPELAPKVCPRPLCWQLCYHVQFSLNLWGGPGH